jgi:hypothetical protein
LVDDFARRFAQEHGYVLRFTEEAAALLVSQAQAAGQPVREYCAAKFKDYQFGLKLIARNKGQQEFVLGAEAVEAPERVLSEWVVASYREESKPQS